MCQTWDVAFCENKMIKWQLFGFLVHTLPETNMFAAENRPGPQKETSTPTIHFQVLC